MCFGLLILGSAANLSFIELLRQWIASQQALALYLQTTYGVEDIIDEALKVSCLDAQPWKLLKEKECSIEVSIYSPRRYRLTYMQ